MLRILLLAAPLLFFLPLRAQAAPPPTGADRVAIQAETLLTEAIRAEDFVGVSAGIYHQDAVVWQGGAGYRNRASQAPATAQMLHRIASISKPMTAAAILQLEAAGHLDLDVPIQRYLPDYPEPKTGTITIRRLLNHTAGVPAYRNRREFTSQVYYPTLWQATAVFRDRKLQFVPGTDFGYTTYGYTVLGAIIEQVTGTAYAEYMREHVWGPAGMLHTDIELTGQDYPNKAKLYRKDRHGDFTKDSRDVLSIKYPGGGLQSTVPDLLAFGRAILDNELISAADLERMRVTPDSERGGTAYGLGWYVVDDPEYGRIVRHGGAQSGTSTYLEIYLDQRLVVAVLANTANAGMEVGALKQKLAGLVLDPAQLARPIPIIVDLDTEQLERFVGRYDLPSGQRIEITRRGDRLWSRSKGFPDVRIFPASERELFYRVFDDRIVLELPADGTVTGAEIRSNGKVTPVRKVK
jgi:CubicO group peptidase (beta-lactamase class C family)